MLFKYIIILVFLLQFKEMLLWLFFFKIFTPKKEKATGTGMNQKKKEKKLKNKIKTQIIADSNTMHSHSNKCFEIKNGDKLTSKPGLEAGLQ